MVTENIYNLLENNGYPGRGIVLGRTPDGTKAVIAYFIMGRSENSRNRIFDPIEGGIQTMAADDSKLVDPSLIIYRPVRVCGQHTIVTNGDQTDTVYDYVSACRVGPCHLGNFGAALETRTFEPDGPNWTPRISGMVTLREGAASYLLSILKSGDGNPDSARRYTFSYAQPVAGEGHFIHTYKCDGNPIPSFEGEPVKIATTNDMQEFAVGLWNSLNADNKVSLFVRYIDIASGKPEDVIINKYDRVVDLEG